MQRLPHSKQLMSWLDRWQGMCMSWLKASVCHHRHGMGSIMADERISTADRTRGFQSAALLHCHASVHTPIGVGPRVLGIEVPHSWWSAEVFKVSSDTIQMITSLSRAAIKAAKKFSSRCRSTYCLHNNQTSSILDSAHGVVLNPNTKSIPVMK